MRWQWAILLWLVAEAPVSALVTAPNTLLVSNRSKLHVAFDTMDKSMNSDESITMQVIHPLPNSLVQDANIPLSISFRQGHITSRNPFLCEACVGILKHPGVFGIGIAPTFDHNECFNFKLEPGGQLVHNAVARTIHDQTNNGMNKRELFVQCTETDNNNGTIRDDPRADADNYPIICIGTPSHAGGYRTIRAAVKCRDAGTENQSNIDRIATSMRTGAGSTERHLISDVRIRVTRGCEIAPPSPPHWFPPIAKEFTLFMGHVIRPYEHKYARGNGNTDNTLNRNTWDELLDQNRRAHASPTALYEAMQGFSFQQLHALVHEHDMAFFVGVYHNDSQGGASRGPGPLTTLMDAPGFSWFKTILPMDSWLGLGGEEGEKGEKGEKGRVDAASQRGVLQTVAKHVCASLSPSPSPSLNPTAASVASRDRCEVLVWAMVLEVGVTAARYLDVMSAYECAVLAHQGPPPPMPPLPSATDHGGIGGGGGLLPLHDRGYPIGQWRVEGHTGHNLMSTATVRDIALGLLWEYDDEEEGERGERGEEPHGQGQGHGEGHREGRTVLDYDYPYHYPYPYMSPFPGGFFSEDTRYRAFATTPTPRPPSASTSASTVDNGSNNNNGKDKERKGESESDSESDGFGFGRYSPVPSSICEVGSNMGHSLLTWLFFSPPSTTAFSFDLLDKGYSAPALVKVLPNLFPHRLLLLGGNSHQTLKMFAKLSGSNSNSNSSGSYSSGKGSGKGSGSGVCDVMFIDGDHTEGGAYEDILDAKKLMKNRITRSRSSRGSSKTSSTSSVDGEALATDTDLTTRRAAGRARLRGHLVLIDDTAYPNVRSAQLRAVKENVLKPARRKAKTGRKAMASVGLDIDASGNTDRGGAAGIDNIGGQSDDVRLQLRRDDGGDLLKVGVLSGFRREVKNSPRYYRMAQASLQQFVYDFFPPPPPQSKEWNNQHEDGREYGVGPGHGVVADIRTNYPPFTGDLGGLLRILPSPTNNTNNNATPQGMEYGYRFYNWPNEHILNFIETGVYM